ncbi:MAG: glycosyltransferase, partial [Pseudomonadota bacterium]
MTNESPQITVVVVFRNEEKNLQRLLGSFKKQFKETEPSGFEFLFINNASTDQSLNVVKAFR